MYDNVLLIVVGSVILCLSLFAKTISYGMPPHREKPKYAMTKRLRIALFCVGLLSIALGVAGTLRQ